MSGEIVAVVDCPDSAYLAALDQAVPHLDAAAAGSKHPADRLLLMVHLAPECICHSERYQGVVKQLQGWQHVFVNNVYDAARHRPSLASSHHLQVCSAAPCGQP